MSLLLTFHIKPILEELGLPDCTLGVRSSNLVITGPCGQQLFIIPGFNQLTIKKTEIPIAIELVTKFLTTNVTIIKEFFELRQAKKTQLTQFEYLKEELQRTSKYSITQATYGNSPTYNVHKYEDFGYVIMKTNNFKIDYIHIKETADLKKTLKLIPALQKQMQQDLLFLSEMDKVSKKLDEVTKKLKSCTVY